LRSSRFFPRTQNVADTASFFSVASIGEIVQTIVKVSAIAFFERFSRATK
jgi:hypothetical protein